MATAEAPAPLAAPGRGSLWRVWEDLELPPGFHAEILQGKINVSPAPTNKHNHTRWLLIQNFQRTLEKHDWLPLSETAIYIPQRDEILIPDLIIMPFQVLEESEESTTMLPDEALLVAEVTSPSSVNHDRKTKLASYASAGIPVYLLVDRHDGEGRIKVYSSPNRDGGYYSHHDQVAFGEKIWIPEPIGVQLDSTKFPTLKRR